MNCKSTEILSLDLKVLNFFGFNPFKVSWRFFLSFNFIYTVFVITPTISFIVANRHSNYEIISQSISELYFEILKLIFNSTFFLRQGELVQLICNLREMWNNCE